ncbi:MAG TPA: hypothetical protein VGR02_17320 [Thermoanaerobaculia bacterium]|jgi:hypothetical protein|nr:hypothetical protein [Thermoanaerobaculia bacterium]
MVNRTPRLLTTALLVACISVTAAPSQAQTLPPLPAQTLSGKAIVLPRDLQGTSILVVGFSKQSRKETQAWAERLQKDRQAMTTAVSYDVVVLDGVPGFIRSAILRQLSSSVPKERHDRFLVVSEAAAKWKQFLHVTDEDAAYLAVIGSRGEVIWTARGALTEGNYEQLRLRVAAKQ